MQMVKLAYHPWSALPFLPLCSRPPQRNHNEIQSLINFFLKVHFKINPNAHIPSEMVLCTTISAKGPARAMHRLWVRLFSFISPPVSVRIFACFSITLLTSLLFKTSWNSKQIHFLYIVMYTQSTYVCIVSMVLPHNTTVDLLFMHKMIIAFFMSYCTRTLFKACVH